jgi:hypothetical protein
MYFDVSNVLVTNSLALRLTSGSTTNVPGTTNNSTSAGRNLSSTDTIIVYDVPFTAPSSIIYQDVTDLGIGGNINVLDKVGPTGQTGPAGPVGSPLTAAFTPVWSGTGLTLVGTPTSGTYVKYGDFVTFSMKIDFANVSAVGTGQYQVTLPVLPIAGVAYSFSGILDVAGDFGGTNYHIVANNTPGSAFITLWFLGSNDTRTALTGAAPATLTTASEIFISGTYIASA